MSYIEKKSREKIKEIFNFLKNLEISLLNELDKKSVRHGDEIAKLCANFTKNINIILKKYYPEIKKMDDKLEIKSYLKFYYDLIDKLTDLIRNIENLRNIDQNYYNVLMQFIQEKNDLISGKYKTICTRELTAFYDPITRKNLEKILESKIANQGREFFTFGTFEEEIKKIGRIAGANEIFIKSADDLDKNDLNTAQSIISYDIESNKIGQAIKNFLNSKKYKVILKSRRVITDAKLIPDKI